MESKEGHPDQTIFVTTKDRQGFVVAQKSGLVERPSMLVHFHIPKGNVILEGRRIYGISSGFPPTDVPFNVFKKHCVRDRISRQEGNILVQATYRARDLAKLFGRPFHEVAFKYDELHALHNKTLIRLGEEMSIEPKHELDIENKPVDRKHLLELIKRALREVSPEC
jgi:hypothetical protein